MCSKRANIDLELLTNVAMILDYNNDIRGGVRRAISHHNESKNKYLHDCDETKEITYIQYLDLNNQYR